MSMHLMVVTCIGPVGHADRATGVHCVGYCRDVGLVAVSIVRSCCRVVVYSELCVNSRFVFRR